MKPFKASDFSNFDSFREACLEVLNIDDYQPPKACFPSKATSPAKGIHKLLYRCPVSGQSQMVNTPDGVTVSSSIAPWSYTMNPASRLVGKDGSITSLVEVYQHINQMPMLASDNGQILDQPAGIFIEYQYPLLKSLGDGRVKLFADRLEWVSGAQQGVLPIEEILYVSIEQSHKLSLTTRNFMLQLVFPLTSPLECQHYIRRLQQNEQTVLSL